MAVIEVQEQTAEALRAQAEARGLSLPLSPAEFLGHLK
jgi:hypothetical protein